MVPPSVYSSVTLLKREKLGKVRRQKRVCEGTQRYACPVRSTVLRLSAVVLVLQNHHGGLGQLRWVSDRWNDRDDVLGVACGFVEGRGG